MLKTRLAKKDSVQKSPIIPDHKSPMRTIVPCSILLCKMLIGCIGTSEGDPNPNSTDTEKASGETDPTTEPPSDPKDSDLDTAQITPNDEDCPDIDALKNGVSLAYYRLRLKFSSSSKHSTLLFNNHDRLLNVKRMEPTTENPTVDELKLNQIRLNQSDADDDAGIEMTLVADYAIRGSQIDAPLSVDLTKGSSGSVTAEFFLVEDTNEQLVPLASQTLGTRQEKTSFSLDLSKLKNHEPRRGPVLPVRRMVWAPYYPWYHDHFWKNNDYCLRDRPDEDYYGVPNGEYDSSDYEIIDKQIKAAKRAGIDGFFYSWFGPYAYDGDGLHRHEQNLPTVLSAAQANDFYLAIYLEARKLVDIHGPDRITSVLSEYIEYFHNKYSDHPAIMKVDGRLVIIPFVSSAISPEAWQEIRQNLSNKGIGILLIQDRDKTEYFTATDGALDSFDEDSGQDRIRSKAFRYHALLHETEQPKIWLSSARPGYDDRLIDREGEKRFLDRRDGQTFREQLQEAISANPQWIRIYTWNEYPEHTYVEPSRKFGDLYVNIAAEMLKAWKCQD